MLLSLYQIKRERERGERERVRLVGEDKAHDIEKFKPYIKKFYICPFPTN